MSTEMKSTWWVSTDMIGKPGSPKTAGPFSTREDAFAARMGMEAMGANLSVFEEEPKPPVVLPDTPTLGWLSVTDAGYAPHDPGTVLDIWDIRQTVVKGGNAGSWSRELVTAFTEAIAVPKAEYEALLEALRFGDHGDIENAAEVLRVSTRAAGEGK